MRQITAAMVSAIMIGTILDREERDLSSLERWLIDLWMRLASVMHITGLSLIQLTKEFTQQSDMLGIAWNIYRLTMQGTNTSLAQSSSTVEDRLFSTTSTELMILLWCRVEDGLASIILSWPRLRLTCSSALPKPNNWGRVGMLLATSSTGLDSQLLQELTTFLLINQPQARLTSPTLWLALVVQASMQLIDSTEREGNIQIKLKRLEILVCLSSQTGSAAGLSPSNLWEPQLRWSWVAWDTFPPIISSSIKSLLILESPQSTFPWMETQSSNLQDSLTLEMTIIVWMSGAQPKVLIITSTLPTESKDRSLGWILSKSSPSRSIWFSLPLKTSTFYHKSSFLRLIPKFRMRRRDWQSLVIMFTLRIPGTETGKTISMWTLKTPSHTSLVSVSCSGTISSQFFSLGSDTGWPISRFILDNKVLISMIPTLSTSLASKTSLKLSLATKPTNLCQNKTVTSVTPPMHHISTKLWLTSLISETSLTEHWHLALTK